MGGGPRVPYPKHVWSPTGGWYTQPSNWKANTAVFSLVVLGITGLAWKLSADREFRHKMPEPGRFFPSRKYVSLCIVDNAKNEGMLLLILTQLEQADYRARASTGRKEERLMMRTIHLCLRSRFVYISSRNGIKDFD
ncbi:hypothetical protein BJ166DRAFT_322031 [Pestalotiopsis sp. NC0098]|nr:hypothetical protein BJ166DRAFT_322031 [Pestalotiopsis sp. NC0098]